MTFDLHAYQQFLEAKVAIAEPRGLSDCPSLKSHLFAFQRHCVEFGLRAGSFGLFLDTGLGKTACELEWAAHASEASNGKALILTPLAVARQHEAEAHRWGYDARVIRDQFDARPGINICNYDRLEKLDVNEFGAVVLDESSIIKNFTGKTTQALISIFRSHRWRMAATATPAPNDHMELGTHSEFLGVMPMNDMLVRWFINDSADTGTWRLKGHARKSFWEWMASWSRMAEHPRDLGDEVSGYDLPPLKVITHQAESSDVKPLEGTLFAVDVSATRIFDIKRQTTESRARTVREILAQRNESAIVWCDTDAESAELKSQLSPIFGKKVLEVKGSMSIDAKESALAAFADGSAQVLISKSSICGYGLNWQRCALMVFAGRSFSYESYYQAVRRCWRFGQKRQVEVHLVVAEGEDSIGRVIDRKADDHASMKSEMKQTMRRALGMSSQVKRAYEPKHEGRLPKWLSV